jgi:D-arabinose 1-dehydrogenase-like Zn-dependent alcohol dehydrogenase
MRAAIIETPRQIRVGNIPDPTPKPDELVIRVGACGICGTDLHVVDGDSPLLRYPIVPDHEFAGEVVAVGSRGMARIRSHNSHFCLMPHQP